MNIQDITDRYTSSNFLFISLNFKAIFDSPWKCSYRTVIADKILVLYFKMKKHLQNFY